MFAERNRKGNTVNPDINTKEMCFTKLKDYIGAEPIQIFGFFISKSRNFGESKQVTVVTRDVLITLPQRYTEEFESWTLDMIEACKAGKCAIGNIHEIDTKSGKSVSFDFMDWEVSE